MEILFWWIALQIITESFPISSSSHRLLFEQYIHQRYQSDFLSYIPAHYDDFLLIVNLVVFALFFWHRWVGALQGIFRYWSLIGVIVVRTAVACSMTVLCYFLFHGPLAIFFSMPLWIGLSITALLLLSLRLIPTSHYESYTIGKALIIGMVQGMALLPGISRLGSTYVAARFLHLSPRHALEASIAAYVPLIMIAFVRSCLILFAWPYKAQLLNMSVGLVMLISGIIAYVGFKCVAHAAQKHTMWRFFWYMMVPLLLVCVLR